MGEIVSTLGGRIVDSGLSACLITFAVALAMVATRQPSRRRALARAGVLGALLAIPIVCLRPFEPFQLLNMGWAGVRPALMWIGDRLGTGDPTRWLRTLAPASRGIAYLPAILLGLYLAGVLFGLARFALGWWGAGWIQINSAAASSFAVELYKSLPYTANRTRPRLRVSTRTRRPVLLGTFNETILIPPDMDRPEAATALRLTLLHELAHAEASDPWFGLASELASIFWFPLPPLWWIQRQMRLDQEYLADRQAAEGFGAPSRYAASLVDIAAGTSAKGAGENRDSGKSQATSALFPRVLMLIRAPFVLEGQPPAWWRLALAGTTVVLLITATAITLRFTRAALPPAPELRTFSMPSLIIDDSPMSVSEIVLPVKLPPDFSLTLSVHATHSELSQLSILGVPLAPALILDTNLVPEERVWQKVKLDRKGGRVTLAVNQGKPAEHPADCHANALSVRSSTGRRMTFRTIQLTW